MSTSQAPFDEDGSTPWHWTNEAIAKWLPIRNEFGPTLVEDIRRAIKQNPCGYDKLVLDRSARKFFAELARTKRDPRFSRLFESYRSGIGSTGAPHEAIQIEVIVFFNDFCDRMLAVSSAGTTAWNEHRCAAYVLDWLAKLGPRRYPAFSVVLHKRKRGSGETPMLGSLPVAKDIGEPPGALRERKALDLVGQLALREFNDHVEIIEHGAAIRSKASTGKDSDCVRRVLDEVWSNLPIRPNGRRSFSDLIGIELGEAHDPATWVAAGIPERCVTRFAPLAEQMDLNTVVSLALACLGPSATMIVAGAAVVACGRGWNKSPILMIPSDPFVFAIEGKYGAADASFVAAVKKRARHEVVMVLEGSNRANERLPEELLDELSEVWREVAADEKDASEMLLADDPNDVWGRAILGVLHSMIRLSKPLRTHDPVYGSIDRLFAFPPLNKRHKHRFEGGLNIALLSTTPALVEGGVTFPSIRASWYVDDYLRNGSLPKTASAGGQISKGVPLRSYLNRQEVGEELRKSLRFFLSVCEVLVIRNVNVVRLNVSDADHERIERLARASGIAAAFGLDMPRVDTPAVLQFVPNPENLRDLFLTLWALRRAARILPPATWKARCLELFVAASAIARQLRGPASLGPAFAAAARTAYADHKAGRVALPRVEGV